MSQLQKFRAHLQRVGIGLEETKRLLLAYAEYDDFAKVKRSAFESNLLGKNSESVISDTVYAFRRRFLAKSGLPPAKLVALVLNTDISDTAKHQILFPYFVLTDRMVERFYRDLVIPRLHNHNPTLTTEEVLTHMAHLSVEHPELTKWSENLKRKWARAFITFLRRFRLMESRPKKNLQRMWLLAEPFSFFFLWFLKKGGSFWTAIRHPIWELMQVGERDKENLLGEGQLRGWWTYQRSGFIVNFQPTFTDLEALVHSWVGVK